MLHSWARRLTAVSLRAYVVGLSVSRLLGFACVVNLAAGACLRV